VTRIPFSKEALLMLHAAFDSVCFFEQLRFFFFPPENFGSMEKIEEKEKRKRKTKIGQRNKYLFSKEFNDNLKELNNKQILLEKNWQHSKQIAKTPQQ
jgi:hypothetical protein